MLIEVADNGTGIDPEILPKLFDPFFTTKEVGEGTGLGLSIVHNIVRAHGGHVEVDSQLGVGTCFRVYLPLRAPQEVS
jgi:signal transduction histidine kinase